MSSILSGYEELVLWSQHELQQLLVFLFINQPDSFYVQNFG